MCQHRLGNAAAMPQRHSTGIGNASTSISRECALQELGISDPNPSNERIQQAYKRMAMKWYSVHS